MALAGCAVRVAATAAWIVASVSGVDALRQAVATKLVRISAIVSRFISILSLAIEHLAGSEEAVIPRWREARRRWTPVSESIVVDYRICARAYRGRENS